MQSECGLIVLTLILHCMLLLHMLFTQQAGPEALVTHGAFERLDVDYHVAVQAAVGGEWGVANITLEGLHSCRWERQGFTWCPQVIFKTFQEVLLKKFNSRTTNSKTG